jgi:hypothetical protein
MAWTKREYISEAFAEIGIASYDFDLSAEQLESALRRLDSMMATWNALGIRIGYPLPSSPGDSTLATVTNVPDASNEAIYLNLALRLAPSYGKIVSNETKSKAEQSYSALLAKISYPQEMQYDPLVPAGAGYKTRRTFLDDPSEKYTVGNDSELTLE